MKDLINRLQKDLNKLQETLQKEGDDLVNKIKTKAIAAAQSKNVVQKRAEIEKLLEQKIKKFEPALEKFYRDLKTNAGKYGINLDNLESQVRNTAKKAQSRLTKAGTGTTKKKTAGKKATAKKAPQAGAAKKAGAKKKTTKKST